MLPGDLTLFIIQDIATKLQNELEDLEDVERAFVHVDYQKRDGLVHKIEREFRMKGLPDGEMVKSKSAPDAMSVTQMSPTTQSTIASPLSPKDQIFVVEKMTRSVSRRVKSRDSSYHNISSRQLINQDSSLVGSGRKNSTHRKVTPASDSVTYFP